MNGFTDEKSKDILHWLNWLSNKWNSYEAFLHFEDGINPKEVAENFLDLNKVELLKFFEALDNDDLDALDQMQKLTETESHVFKMIKEQINRRTKVRYVDFQRKCK